MDVSAFQADADGDLTWEDLVPDAVREPVRHGAWILARLGGLVMFIIMLVGCAIAFVLMLVWIALYWTLTRLLLATAGLLRIIYEEPSIPQKTATTAKPDDSTNGNPGPESDRSQTEKPLITGADLDHFESFLTSNRTPSRQHQNISSDRLRETALERISKQEKEIDAEISKKPKTSTSSSGAIKSTRSNAHSEMKPTHFKSMYSAEQLAEAASFAKAVSRRSTVTDLHTPKALPPHLKRLNAAKAAKSNNPAPQSPLMPLQTSKPISAARNLADSEGERGLLTSETPPLAIKTDGETSIEALKALDPRSRQRRPRLPRSFIAGVERSIRIIAGKEEGLQRTLRKVAHTEKEHVTTFSDQRILRNEANQASNLHDDHHSYGEQDKFTQTDIKQSPSRDPSLAHDFEDQNELTDEAPDGDETGLIERSSLYDELHNDQDQEEANQDLTSQSQSCDLTVVDVSNEVAGSADSQPTIVSNKTSSDNAFSLELPEGRVLFKEMDGLFNKSVENNETSATTTVHDKKHLKADSTTEDTPTTTHSAGHELDLVGLDFSAATTSPIDPTPTTKPQLQASSREFAPGTTLLRDCAMQRQNEEEQRLQNERQERLNARLAQSQAARTLRKEREAEVAAAAITASKEAEQTFVVPEHSYWPDPFSGSGFSFSANADIMPMHIQAASYPSSAYFTPFGSSERVWQAPPPQPLPQIDYPAPGYSTSRFDLSMPQPTQHLSSAPLASIHPKPPSFSKGVPIKKPSEVKFNEDFPKLPSTKSTVQNVQVQPPPGLSSSKGSSQTTFDALLSVQPKAASTLGGAMTSNPFDALLHTSNSMQHSAEATANEVSHHDQRQDAGIESDAQSKATQKKRKQVRTDLAIAWVQRESIRKRVVGTYTLDGRRALDYATKTYDDLRSQLASLMATGELREEDAKIFEYFSTSELRVPSVGVTTIRKLIPDEKMELSSVVASKTGAVQDVKKENKAPKRSDDEIAELTKKALNARNVYAEAHAWFQRPPRQGRASIKDLRAQGEQKIERAARYYAHAREELAAAYGSALPTEMKEKLWTYDDGAMKKSRDSWMP